jgi:phosphate:Na+ symporter
MNIVLSIVFPLLGGLAFFLYGMTVMSNGLEKMAGGRLESALKKMTSNPFISIVLGAGITIAIQSSSALTVMLVGLVNSGIMEFERTICVIMGSNIGTTLTAWILSLTGLDGDNFFIELLKPKNFSPIIALVGILLVMASKQRKNKDIGEIMVGFAVLMTGMNLMSGAMEPLAGSPEFAQVLTAFENPIVGVIVGAVFTGIIQSSAASVGVLQALASNGLITIGMAIPIVMGQNIGTCVTALISSIGTSSKAKKVAFVHVTLNVATTLFFLIVYYIVSPFMPAILAEFADAWMIALIHSVFNVSMTILFLPFTRLIAKLANLVISDKNETKQEELIFDDRLLTVPAFALANAREAVVKMSSIANESVCKSIEMMNKFNSAEAERIETLENKLDIYEDKLGTYLVKLSKCELTDSQNGENAMLLHVIGDFERIGDHSENLLDVAKEMHEKKISFSQEAKAEIACLTEAITEILDITNKTFERNDLELAAKVEPLEQVIDSLIAEIKNRHIARLQSGNCTIELGFILTDFLTNCERISDHCSNIAAVLIETGLGALDMHEYLNEIKSKEIGHYADYYRDYAEKYSLK